MLSCVYRLTSPRIFEPVQVELSLDAEHVLVRPTHLSICNADQRYYRGTRNQDALRQKLPMALIHEGIGVVMEDSTGVYKRGERVVLLPNESQSTDPCISENYLPSSKFSGSGYDGFMQEYVSLPHNRLLKLPASVPDSVASFTELISVVVHSIARLERLSHARKEVFGVWGDGNLGFIVALLLRAFYPDSRIIVFGHNSHKLNDFTFVDQVHLTPEASEWSNNSDCSIDHAFECCGGNGSLTAIEQIISYIKPEGTMALMGVSENIIPINTRMILEKGLKIVGNSRSSTEDFAKTITIYEQTPWVLDYLGSLVSQVVKVESILDIVVAFEADMRKSMGKTIMEWKV